MNPLISKARKPKFELHLKIVDLNNVPLVSGSSYVKWHLPSSIAAEHRGRTEKCLIKDHKVSWEYSRTISVRLLIDKNSNLHECLINFEVVQDYNSGIRGEKITLGLVNLNLAEYVEESEDGDEGVVRRYLMQDSKINSTLKVGIAMKQIDGERNFIAPALKSAPVFGGIAGIVAGELGDTDDIGSLPLPQIAKTRDHCELQDMYRRALAASWLSQTGELPPDKCVEEIFAGGDGWLHDGHHESQLSQGSRSPSADELHIQNHHHHRMHSGDSSKSSSTITAKGGDGKTHRHSGSKDSISHTTGIQRHPGHAPHDRSESMTPSYEKHHEVNEFDVREDLIAWRLPEKIL